MHNQTVVSESVLGLPSSQFSTPSAPCPPPSSASDEVVATRVALLQLAEQLGSVAQACRRMGFSRGTFYRMKERYAARGEAGLREIDRRGRIPKNRFDASVETLVVELAHAHPTWGRRRFVAVLAARGIAISASGVRCIWKRNSLLKGRERETDRSSSQPTTGC